MPPEIRPDRFSVPSRSSRGSATPDFNKRQVCYDTPWGQTYTYNQLTAQLAEPLVRALRSRLRIPEDLLDDAEQSAYILLWAKLQEEPGFLLQFTCKGPRGLATILAIRGQKCAFTHNERAYRARYLLSPEEGDHADIYGDPFPYNVHSPRERSNGHKRSRPFMSRRLDATRKDLSGALNVDGHKNGWRDLSELRIDLQQALLAIFSNADQVQRRQHKIGLDCLLFGKPCPEAARQYNIPVTSVKRYMYRIRDLLRPHFETYMQLPV